MTLYARIAHEHAVAAFAPPRKQPLRKLTYDSCANKYRAEARFNRLGGETLGSGCFGVAMSHPKDSTKVIKIGPLNDGWLIWAAYCLIKAGTSPHLMKVYSIKRYETQGIYVAVIERLKCEVNQISEAARVDWRLIRNGFNQGIHDNATERGSYCDPVPTRKVNEVLNKYGWASVLPLLLEVQTFAKENGLARDLHGQNVMIREDGTLVLTDPFSSSSPRAHEVINKMSA